MQFREKCVVTEVYTCRCVRPYNLLRKKKLFNQTDGVYPIYRHFKLSSWRYFQSFARNETLKDKLEGSK
jgi:hypothetical protein